MTVRARLASWSLARRLFALQAVIIVLVVAGGTVLAYVDARQLVLHEAESRVTGVAVTVANSPDVLAGLGSADPTASLQSYADAVQARTGVDFVVIMAPDRTRYTHPTRSEIGKPFIGTIAPALAGQTFTETYTGSLGPSLRAVTPVRDTGGTVRGLVSVGITLTAIGSQLARDIGGVLLLAAVTLAIGAVGSYLLSRWLRRRTHNLGPAEITRMYEYYDSVLHAVREGLLLLDNHARIVLANDEARRLLALPPDCDGRRIDQVGPSELGAALAGGIARTDELHLSEDRVLVVNQAAARDGNRMLGTVVTLRDHTDLRELSNELDTVRGLAESLRSQAHEAANRMHAVVSLIEIGETAEAVEFATAEMRFAQELTDRVLASVEEPVLAALLLGKSAQAGERGVELVLDESSRVVSGVLEARDLVTVLGNLLDNAIDAAASGPVPRWVRLTVRTGEDGGLDLRVADSGPGLADDDLTMAFTRGFTTKPSTTGHGRGLGLGLVRQVVRRYHGQITVGRETGAVFTVHIPARVPA